MKNRNKRARQLPLLKNEKSDHGGTLKITRKRKRPLSTKQTMHIVLRSSHAKGKFSFLKHKQEIDEILKRFSEKYYISILRTANVGNHIHLHIKIFKRSFYPSFIRAVTSAIMMKVTGYSKWNLKPKNFQFWDYRPFSRIVSGFRAFQTLVDYILLNQFEATGLERWQAKHNVKVLRRLRTHPT